MHLGDHLGTRQRENVVVAPEVAAVRTQALTAKAGLIELALLDHRAHRAIEQHDALIEQPLEALDARASFSLVERLDRKGCGGRVRPGRSAALALLVGACRGVGGMSARAHALTHGARPAAGAHGRRPSAWQMA